MELYGRVVELNKQGLTDRAIGRALHIGRKTVGRFLRAGQFPERAKPRRPGPRVNKFRDYLQQRWSEGCHNASKLWHEIQPLGYTGGRSMVATLVSTFRTLAAKCHCQDIQPACKRKPRLLSPRQAAMLIARKPEKLEDSDRRLITQLEQACPAIAALRPFVRSFSNLLRTKEPDALQPWIDKASALGFPAIKSFCDGLARDRDAVIAAIALKWSNGQVEGQIHRLKLIKRQMYGRASFKLLRARVLPYDFVADQLAQQSP